MDSTLISSDDQIAGERLVFIQKLNGGCPGRFSADLRLNYREDRPGNHYHGFHPKLSSSTSCILGGVAFSALLRVSAHTLATSTSQWSPCASKSYSVSITDVLISPDPVVAGYLATFTIPAYSELELEGGTVVITVLFHGIKVHTEKDDLCSKADCPIQGEFTLNNSEALPAYTPPGSYTLKFQLLDTSGAELTCASISFSIVWKLESEQLVDAAEALYRKISKRNVAVV